MPSRAPQVVLQQDPVQDEAVRNRQRHANVDITGLCVVKSEPPVWFCDVDGKRVELLTEDLQTPQKFQKACMEQIHLMPPLMKLGDWQAMVTVLMSDMSEIDVPEELTYKGQFMDLSKSSARSGQAASPEETGTGQAVDRR